MIRHGLEDRTCCVATPKGGLIPYDASAGILTQPTATWPLRGLAAQGHRIIYPAKTVC